MRSNISYRNSSLTLLLTICLLSAFACNDNINEDPPERIVSLAPGNTEILFALGLGDSVVGVTENCDYPPETQWKPTVGGFSTIDPELVIEMEPDLVLAAPIHSGTVIDMLKDQDIRVLKISSTTIDEVLMFISLTGVMTFRDQEASILRNDMEQRIDNIVNRVNPSNQNSSLQADRPRVCFVTWHDPPYTVGNDTLIHDLIHRVGGSNIFSDATGHFQTNPEIIAMQNPDIIIALTGHGTAEDDPYNWAVTNENLENTSARKNNRIYPVDASLVTRPGPRIVDGLELIAKCIFPEVFEEVKQDFNMSEESTTDMQ